MRLALALAALTLALWAAPGWAEESFATCARVAATAERLACFDRVSKDAGLDTAKPAAEAAQPKAPALNAPSADSDSKPEPPGATTKEVVNSFSSTEYHVADPADIAVAPRKFVGKPIEVRHFHCYYADKDDYRCVAPGPYVVTVFTSDLIPLAEKEGLENDCGAIKLLLTPKCERNLHLVYSNYSHDQIEMRDRVSIKPDFAVVLPPTVRPVAGKRR